eukprot:4905505-Prorocentrum_lima.AAC.1
MTSSLVGSEMCIRDSNYPTLAASQCVISLARVAVAAHEQLGLDLAMSVSYTHLTLPTICSV